MIQINFAPKKYVEKIYSSIIVAKLIFLAFIVVLIMAVVSFLHYQKYRTLLLENENLVKEYQMLSKNVELAKKVETEIKEIEGYISRIEKLNQGRYLYIAFMQDLVNNLPTTIWFSGIETKTYMDSIEVRINVNSNNLEDLLWWFSYIDNNKRRYSEAKISSIVYNSDYYNTQITFKYRYAI